MKRDNGFYQKQAMRSVETAACNSNRRLQFIVESALYSHPPPLVGGVRGRASELAGGVIISKDKPPPASAKALAPPPEAGGEMIDGRGVR